MVPVSLRLKRSTAADGLLARHHDIALVWTRREVHLAVDVADLRRARSTRRPRTDSATSIAT